PSTTLRVVPLPETSSGRIWSGAFGQPFSDLAGETGFGGEAVADLGDAAVDAAAFVGRDGVAEAFELADHRRVARGGGETGDVAGAARGIDQGVDFGAMGQREIEGH